MVRGRGMVVSWSICWLQRPKEDGIRRLCGTVMGMTGSFGSMVGLLHVREGFHVARVVLRHWNMRRKLWLWLWLMMLNVICWRGARLMVGWCWTRMMVDWLWTRLMMVDWLWSPTVGRHLVCGRFLQAV